MRVVHVFSRAACETAYPASVLRNLLSSPFTYLISAFMTLSRWSFWWWGSPPSGSRKFECAATAYTWSNSIDSSIQSEKNQLNTPIEYLMIINHKYIYISFDRNNGKYFAILWFPFLLIQNSCLPFKNFINLMWWVQLSIEHDDSRLNSIKSYSRNILCEI